MQTNHTEMQYLPFSPQRDCRLFFICFVFNVVVFIFSKIIKNIFAGWTDLTEVSKLSLMCKTLAMPL